MHIIILLMIRGLLYVVFVPRCKASYNYDFTPEKCAANQGGPVWFLADQLGGREERTCSIPAGKAILIPLLNGECGYDVPEVKIDEDMCTCASAGNEYGAYLTQLNLLSSKRFCKGQSVFQRLISSFHILHTSLLTPDLVYPLPLLTHSLMLSSATD